MFTKQHYEAIAKIIKQEIEWSESYQTEGVRTNTCKHIALDLAQYFESDNPRFDRKRFLEACGVSGTDWGAFGD